MMNPSVPSFFNKSKLFLITSAYIFPYFKRNWIVKTYRLVDIKDSLGTRSLDDRVQTFIWNACNRGINERRD